MSGPDFSGLGSFGPCEVQVQSRAVLPQSLASVQRPAAQGDPPQLAAGTHLTELGQFLHAHWLHLDLEIFESRSLGQLADGFAWKPLLVLCLWQLGKHFLQPGARFFRAAVPGDTPYQGGPRHRGPELSFGADLGAQGLFS